MLGKEISRLSRKFQSRLHGNGDACAILASPIHVIALFQTPRVKRAYVDDLRKRLCESKAAQEDMKQEEAG